jgi:DNA-binding transcriptional MerR regulator
MTSPVADPAETDPKVVPDPGLPIAEVARRTGLSKDTLRYYEKAGLIEAVDRSSAGQRRYATTDLDWLAFLMRLRATGMSIADMQLFAELRRKGSSSVTGRLDLLTGHRNTVQRHIADLQGDLQVLDTKIAHYQDLLNKQTGTDQL